MKQDNTQKKRKGTGIKLKLIRLLFIGLSSLLFSVMKVSAFSLIEYMDDMINSGNNFETLIARVVIAGLLSAPIIFFFVYIKIKTNFARVSLSAVFFVAMLFFSSNIKSLELATTIAWSLSLITGIFALKTQESKEAHWKWDEANKFNPLMIGLILGLISMFIAPFNSLLSGGILPNPFAEQGLIDLIKSPFMWVLIGIFFGAGGGIIVKTIASKTNLNKLWNNNSKDTEKDLKKDEEIIAKEIQDNENEIKNSENIVNDLEDIKTEFDKGENMDHDKVNSLVNNVETNIEQQIPKEEQEEELSLQNIRTNETIETIKAMSEHDIKLVKAMNNIFSEKNKQIFREQTALGKAEIDLITLFNTIIDEKESGVWKTFEELEEDNYKHVIESLEQTGIPKLIQKAKHLKNKKTQEKLDILEFSNLLRSWVKEIEETKTEIKSMLSEKGRETLNNGKLLRSKIKDIQEHVNNIKLKRKDLAKYKKVAYKYINQLKLYSKVLPNDKIELMQRVQTVLPLLERAKWKKDFDEHENTELKEIETDVKTVKQNLADIGRTIKSGEPQRKIFDKILNEIGMNRKSILRIYEKETAKSAA